MNEEIEKKERSVALQMADFLRDYGRLTPTGRRVYLACLVARPRIIFGSGDIAAIAQELGISTRWAARSLRDIHDSKRLSLGVSVWLGKWDRRKKSDKEKKDA